MNEKTDMHNFVWRAYNVHDGFFMNEKKKKKKKKTKCTISYGGRTMCTSVFSFIPQGNEKINNQFLNEILHNVDIDKS